MLNNHPPYGTQFPSKIKSMERSYCMSGSIHLRKDVKHPYWFINWYDADIMRGRHISHNLRGERMHKTHPQDDPKLDRGLHAANVLLSQMQSDVENRTFRLEKYTNLGWTDVVEYYEKWLHAMETEIKRSPATIKGYRSYLNNWIKPFFQQHPVMLHEIQLDTLYKLKGFIKLEPKTTLNIIMAFHSFMDFCKRSNRIQIMPEFPKLEDYDLEEPDFDWLWEEEQMLVINSIDEVHRPIFLWLKFHFRRPCEACALHKVDYDPINNSFTVRRSISARILVNRTKTRKKKRSAIHYIPCHSDFTHFAKRLLNMNLESPFLFVNPLARREGKRYTNESLNIIWKRACKKVGVDIKLYHGLKHSSCTQFINEKGGSDEELQMLTDHARIDSVSYYRKIGLDRKRELMERGKTISFTDRLRGKK